ncbi:hypothetical protein B0H14DRAFT_2592013 [Mycena olivaceomarginata]|nr:hypothetical protein B0H14DRAFT_2592013 [Mycena olivaceomarginata]
MATRPNLLTSLPILCPCSVSYHAPAHFFCGTPKRWCTPACCLVLCDSLGYIQCYVLRPHVVQIWEKVLELSVDSDVPRNGDEDINPTPPEIEWGKELEREEQAAAKERNNSEERNLPGETDDRKCRSTPGTLAGEQGATAEDACGAAEECGEQDERCTGQNVFGVVNYT